MSLDLSPDGRTIVFDLLGDLYTLPITGGTATRVTSGQAMDAQPHWSPDGTSIVYVSDRHGADNLWLANADGSNARPLTREENRTFVSPTWTPDGKYVVVSRNGAGAGYNLFLYHRDGGTGVQLTGTGTTGPAAPAAAPAFPSNYVGAAFGPDARYVYSAVRTAAGGGYNQVTLDWQIAVYDRRTGKTFVRTQAPGSGMRPALSPDGKWLVYATRRDSLTSLRIRDLATGDERTLAPDVQRDDQESRYSRDLLPPYAFTPDSKALVVAHHGRIWRVGGRRRCADHDPVPRRSRPDDHGRDHARVRVRRLDPDRAADPQRDAVAERQAARVHGARQVVAARSRDVPDVDDRRRAGGELPAAAPHVVAGRRRVLPLLVARRSPCRLRDVERADRRRRVPRARRRAERVAGHAGAA